MLGIMGLSLYYVMLNNTSCINETVDVGWHFTELPGYPDFDNY